MVSRLVISQKKLPRCYGSSISILSPAKINLYLNIIGKYPDGFHRIESVIERISLCDRITITLTEKKGITISSNIPSLATKDNLCCRAAQLMLDYCDVPYGFAIQLEKKIPVGAGLGGGSSNAASTLLAINQIVGLGLTGDDLFYLGRQLGSDVNFFLADTPFALAEEKGEAVTAWDVKKKFIHCIVWPGLHIATKDIYRASRVKLTKFFNNVNILRYALQRGDDTLVCASIFNALEQSAVAVCNRVKDVRKQLDTSTVPFAMTGSGSAFFSLPMNYSHRTRSMLKTLFSKMPRQWSVFYAQTF